MRRKWYSARTVNRHIHRCHRSARAPFSRLCLLRPCPPTQHGEVPDQEKRPLRCAPSSTSCPWLLTAFSFSASPPMIWECGHCGTPPPFQVHALDCNSISLVWDSGHCGAPPFQMSIFRIVYMGDGSLSKLAFEETATIACALFLGSTRFRPVLPVYFALESTVSVVGKAVIAARPLSTPQSTISHLFSLRLKPCAT